MPMAADSRGSHKLAWDKERTRELFARYKDKGDMAARDQLIVNHLNLVRFLAAKFANRGEPLDDLVQVGTIGLIKAIDRFEPERALVEMRFVEGLTQSQIAERMGMSQVQVSRLLHKTLERMRKDIDPSA